MKKILTREQAEQLIEVFYNLPGYMYIEMYDTEEENAKPIYKALNMNAIAITINECRDLAREEI